MFVCTSLSVQQFWPPKICLWSHTLLIRLITFLKIFSCFWESNCSYKHTISSMSLTLGKIADDSTCHSKKSVAVVLPAVAKMLDAVNKLEMGLVWHGQQWQVTKLSLYSVTNLVQQLLDISLYSVRCTDHVPSFLWNSPASCYFILGHNIPQPVSDYSVPVLCSLCDRPIVTFIQKSPKNYVFV